MKIILLTYWHILLTYWHTSKREESMQENLPSERNWTNNSPIALISTRLARKTTAAASICYGDSSYPPMKSRWAGPFFRQVVQPAPGVLGSTGIPRDFNLEIGIKAASVKVHYKLQGNRCIKEIAALNLRTTKLYSSWHFFGVPFAIQTRWGV